MEYLKFDDGASTKGMTLSHKQHLQSSHQKTQKRLSRLSSSYMPKGSVIFTLETSFTGSEETIGTMFDISAAYGEFVVEVISLDFYTNITQDDCQVMVMRRKGSHLENKTNGWSTLVNGTIQCLGPERKSTIPSNLFQEKPILRSGDFYSLYFMMTGVGIKYTNGTTIGAIYSSSTYLNIHEGNGVLNFLDGDTEISSEPQVWNGAVNYRVEDKKRASKGGALTDCESQLTTSYDNNIGSFGNMFDLVTHEYSIELYGIDIYTDVKDLVTYEIYTRSGSFQDGVDPSIEPNIAPSQASNASLITSNTTNAELLNAMNWTMLKRGTVIGSGKKRGTSILGIVPFIIPKDSIQGFYITLTQPGLRYNSIKQAKPDAKIGDIYRKNDDIDILMGVSVGTYPISQIFFGPRVWSGTVFYRAARECPSSFPSSSPSQMYSSMPTFYPSITNSNVPSSEPSMLPSVIASEAPSNLPSEKPSLAYSQYPSLSPSILVSNLGNCTDASVLMTSLEGGTESYGTMFTVTSLKKIGIITLDVHVATKKEILVEIFTKIGDYVNFAEDHNSWRMVASSMVLGAGEGQLTKIPDEEFQDVFMGVNETRAFYITLSSADLKYSRTKTLVGDAFISDPFLQINAGAGVASTSFGISRFSPRAFNGALHYIYKDNCIDNITTKVLYDFNLMTFQAVDENEVMKSVNENIYETSKGLMKIDSTFRDYEIDYKLDLTDVSTTSLSRNCVPLDEISKCTMIQTELIFSHDEKLDSGKVILAMLKFQTYIETKLIELGIQVDYKGDVVVQAEIIVNLGGTFSSSFSDDEMQYFQAITRAYLKSKLSKVGVDVLDVMASQVGKKKSRYLQGDGETSGSSSIATMVYGSYRPPPEIDFSGVVEDALDVEGGSQFRDDLVTGRQDIPPEIMKKVGALKEVKNVNSTSTTRKEDQLPEVPAKFSIGPILGGILGFLLVSFVICFWCYRKSRRKRKERSQLVALSNGPRSSSKGFSGSKIIDAECQFKDEDSILAEKSNAFVRHPGLSSIETGSTSSGYQEELGTLSSAQSVTLGNRDYVSSRNLSEDIMARRYEKNESVRSGGLESMWYSGKSRRSENLHDAISMQSQSTIGSGETMSLNIRCQASLEKSMSSLGTNRLVVDESVSAFDQSMGKLDSSVMHYPGISTMEMEYIPRDHRSVLRQNIAKGKSMINIHPSKHIDLHNRSVNSLDINTLRNVGHEGNFNFWENQNLIHRQSCDFQAEMLLQNQDQKFGPIGYNGHEYATYEQLDERDFALNIPQTWKESGY